MANTELIDYIQKESRKGFPEKQIRQALIKAGWVVKNIDDAFKSVKIKEVKPKKPDPEQVLKEITEEEIKKEKVTKGPDPTKKFPLNRKKLLLFTIIGILTLIMAYYVYEYIQSLR